MSSAKLTSLSTQTLSLLLERQRLQSISSLSPSSQTSTLHIPQITKNLRQLRAGILALEETDGRSETVSSLRGQYERMKVMLGTDETVESLPDEQPTEAGEYDSSSAPTPPMKDDEPLYTPYVDDPEAAYEPGMLLQTRRQMMDDQDQELDRLSHSIGRQHHISLQINDELDVHTGLLEELDTDLDRTENRLSGARRRLERVAKGTRENGSTVTIGVLILVLLILIIVFKT